MSVPAIRLTTALFILYCITYHVISGVTLLIWPDAQGSTTMAGLMTLFQNTYLVAVCFLGSAIIALLGMKLPFPINIVCLLPQQAILLVAASAVVTSVIVGHFADGVFRPRAFIFADHFNVILMTLFHAIVVILRGAISTRTGEGLLYHPMVRAGLH